MFYVYISRVTECLNSGQTEISIAVDNGVPYQAKLEYLRALSAKPSNQLQLASRTTLGQISPLQPPVLPISRWNAFPSASIPSNFSYDTIYHHLITSATIMSINSSDEDEENNADVGTAKPLRKGRYYFTSGHVLGMKDNSCSTHYFLKSLVRASYKQQEYNVTVTLAQSDAAVVDSSCDCKASAMGRCSHVAGVLFALEDYTVKYGYHPPSCTSQLVKWNIGRKSEKNPQPAHISKYSKKAEPDRIMKHDPRPESSKNPDKPEEFGNKFIMKLYQIPRQTMFATLGDIRYEDYAIKESRRAVLIEHVAKFKEAMIDATGGTIQQIEDTVEQANSETWHRIRRWYVTASKCKRVSGIKSVQAYYTLLKERLFEKTIDTAAMKYGRKHEKTAFIVYRDVMKEQSAMKVVESGFWVNPEYPGFGASPDGLVYDGEKFVGVVEIKCPITVQDIHPGDAMEHLTKKQLNTFCCKEKDGVLKLKPTHQYYYQVQMQMAICDVNWCDFILWSRSGLYIDRVEFDPDFWASTADRLRKAYDNVIVPEFCEMRVPRRLLPFIL